MTFVDRLPAWTVTVAPGTETHAPYRLDFERSPSTAAFAAVMIVAMVVIAALDFSSHFRRCVIEQSFSR